MERIKISKETAVPTGAAIEADTLYLVSTADPSIMECYMSNNAGTALRRLINEVDVQALINASLAGVSAVEIVDDIAARDALSLSSNAMVIVEDASADPTVDSGAALYGYDVSLDSYRKLSEFESLDVVLDWNNIQNRPNSTTAQIDAAVANSHSHANQTQLDLIGQDGDGDITYNNVKVANTYTNTDW